MVCAEFSVCFWHCSWSSHFCPRLRWQRIRRGLTKPSPRPLWRSNRTSPPVEDGKKEDKEKEDEVEKKLDENIPVDPKQDAPSVQGLNGVESDVEPLALNVGHTLKVRFQVLYLDDAFIPATATALQSPQRLSANTKLHTVTLEPPTIRLRFRISNPL